MNIKLFSLVGVLLFFTQMVNAQSTKTSVAVLGGVNFQNLNGKNLDGSTLENDLIVGYHAGINVQIPIAPEFYFQPGILFTTKGAKNTNGLITSTYNLSYLELPLNLVYKGLLGNGFVMLGFGPYVGYGIGGKIKSEGGPITIDTPVEFQNVVEITDPLNVVYYKPFDVGGNVFAGYELENGIFIQVNTQLGMIKINPEDSRIISGNKTSIKNTGYGLSIGYRL